MECNLDGNKSINNIVKTTIKGEEVMEQMMEFRQLGTLIILTVAGIEKNWYDKTGFQ